jgi:ribonuclease HI
MTNDERLLNEFREWLQTREWYWTAQKNTATTNALALFLQQKYHAFVIVGDSEYMMKAIHSRAQKLPMWVQRFQEETNKGFWPWIHKFQALDILDKVTK